MRLNTAQSVPPIFTHEGARASRMSSLAALRRSVLACLLWEDTFYESGEEIATRIGRLVAECDATDVMHVAIEARTDYKLRHVPLLIAAHMARLPEHKMLVEHTVEQIIQRPDEITELLAIIAKLNGVTPDKVKKHVARSVWRGIASTFHKFNEYSLAKYNGGKSAIKLRDALFLSHSKPLDAREQQYTRVERKTKPRAKLNPHESLYKRLVDNELETPDTWEVQLSAGADKKDVFTRLMQEGNLGALALLRNLRNMHEAGVPRDIVKRALQDMKVERVLPFRFISAARAVPQWEDIIEPAMFKCLEGADKLSGETVLLVDTSGSMDAAISKKSDLKRTDAAAGLAILLRELCESVRVYCFSDDARALPPRRGFALRDAINADPGGGTQLARSLATVGRCPDARVIVITDEQEMGHFGSSIFGSTGSLPSVSQLGARNAYIINVAAYQNGIGVDRGWMKIDGWSEAVIEFIRQHEAMEE